MGIFELVLWNTEINNEKRVVMRSFYRRLAGVLLLTITLHTFTCASYPGADTFRGILKYIGNVFKEGSDEFDKHDPSIMKEINERFAENNIGALFAMVNEKMLRIMYSDSSSADDDIYVADRDKIRTVVYEGRKTYRYVLEGEELGAFFTIDTNGDGVEVKKVNSNEEVVFFKTNDDKPTFYMALMKNDDSSDDGDNSPDNGDKVCIKTRMCGARVPK